MSSDDIKLSLLAFPQRWDGTSLDLRIAILPRGNPLSPWFAGVPAFADARLSLTAYVVAGLDSLPAGRDPADAVPLSIVRPTQARDLLTAMAAGIAIADPATKPTPRPAGVAVKKALPPSYTSAFPFDAPRTPHAVSDATFACAVRGEGSKGPPVPFVPTTTLSWGQVLAFALRRPTVAEQIGLVYTASVAVPTEKLRDGGWVFVALADDSDYASAWAATPDLVKLYAARLPELDAPRALFAAALFPVAPSAGGHDALFPEAEAYDDGFAKIVHADQPRQADAASARAGGAPVTEAGIALGWDDEQIVIWQNRQIDPAMAPLDAPLGVVGYRVDVRERGTADWRSLSRVRGDLTVGTIELGTYDGELSLDVVPSKLGRAVDDDFWLPRHFATWRGRSLVVLDDAGIRLQAKADLPASTAPLAPVLDDIPDLRYGQQYEFRVRLVDLTGGGPGLADAAINPGPAPVATIGMQRFVPPRVLSLGDPSVDGRRLTYTVARPNLEYPMAVFSGARSVDELLAALPAARAAGIPLGAPDPGVTAVRVSVAVRGPTETFGTDGVGDAGGVRPLYEIDIPFPVDPTAGLPLAFEFHDVHRLDDLPPADPASPLPLPSARDLTVRAAAVCTGDPTGSVFGNAAARLGTASQRPLRQDSLDERDLWTAALPADRLRAILLQPLPPRDSLERLRIGLAGAPAVAPSPLTQRIADPLQLLAQGMTLRGGLGQRVVFAAAQGIRHHLSPDHGAITFSSNTDLVNQWIVAITLEIDRDWTWDGFADGGITISRADAGIVGVLQPARAIHPAAMTDADRARTRFIFFDAVEPKPRDGELPAELDLSWTASAALRGAATVDPPLVLTCRLPIATRPSQVPRIVSAGLALSPYTRSAHYASTNPRRSAIWIEFEEPPANPRDSYFARVLCHGPDPLLSDRELPAPDEPELAIDPEPSRIITPGQADDRAGLQAMTRLIPSASPVHYLLPLPPELEPSSLDLFGFYVYELRVGHADGWSTAQARFGRPLRVTGLQHPPPPLRCRAMRDATGIVVSAPLAISTSDGQDLTPVAPRTAMQFLLYAQVQQADEADWRNILLGRKLGNVPDLQQPPHGRLERVSYAGWTAAEIQLLLGELALPVDSALSTLAVELFPGAASADPLGADLGHVRILRTSLLVPLDPQCMM